MNGQGIFVKVGLTAICCRAHIMPGVYSSTPVPSPMSNQLKLHIMTIYYRNIFLE